jgi:hypothetical protein
MGLTTDKSHPTTTSNMKEMKAWMLETWAGLHQSLWLHLCFKFNRNNFC